MTTKTQHTEPRPFRYNLQPTLALLIMLVMTMMTTGKVWGQDAITSLTGITSATGRYILASNFSTTGTPANGIGSTSANPFKGTIDGQLVTITGTWDKPLFDYVEDATIKNVIIQSARIENNTANTNIGAIAGNASGSTRIYNCGILSGSISGTGDVGGLVGALDKKTGADVVEGARVINCFSYAEIAGGNNVGGIVGYNKYATKASDIRTMVMNCMFYGDITGGTKRSPVYGGENINNLNSGGLNTFNYYAYDEASSFNAFTEGDNKKYNCALAVEGKYLKRFEFYRLLLNSNKKLAAIYSSTSYATVNPEDMAKWVLETADRTNNTPKPYPVLKAQGYYPSIINPDFAHANQLTLVNGMPSEQDRNKGGKIGTLTVNIKTSKSDGGQSWPSGVSFNETSLTRPRTDKDFGRFNYNYDKVQLPYFEEVGTGNYTENRVVTGWKITAITEVTGDPYTSANYPTTGVTDFPNHNYADRNSSNKDLYDVSGRVFSQGAYFDVPYGVTSITIEPYWGKAAYVADKNYDVVYKNDYTGKQDVTETGAQVIVGTTTFNGQRVETSHDNKSAVANALSYISNTTTGLGGFGPTVYDNAVVLVGNLHLNGVPDGGTNPFTMMSVDMDNDHEPDYSLIYHHKDRTAIAPIRFDFLNIPGTAQAQKPNGASLICNFTIFKTKGWFECTNTASFYTSQLEYENLKDVTKVDSPLILLGGVIDQFVSTQSNEVPGKTIYIHVGGNVWINSFGLGTHSDGSQSTPHVPVSVTGGEFPGFYLTGTYNANAVVRTDNAECYISGGYFHEAAGAAQEQINGDVHWQIYNADIENFFGGGTNDAKPITGNVTVDIYNSHVTLYCGGPKFGNMQSGKKVITNAEGCTFDTYFGAGYGGLSYSRKKYYDNTSPAWGTTLQGYYITDRGKYFDGVTTNSHSGGGNNNQYGKKGPGVATDFDYEFFVWSSGSTGGRFFVKFASFSLAQCNDVESTLKRCTINGNFYGGGSLGKVVGSVTSELDGCTVKGNVFGAGYSATLPTLQVRDGGFTKVPKYNSASGMFEPGVLSGSTEFEWKQHAFPQNGKPAIEESGTPKYVWTDQTLTSENLGSVSGNVELTLKGTTIVGTEGNANTGNVYGGGDESHVTKNAGSGGNTTVNLEGSVQVLGNVYGGGNRGPVEGDSKVNIQDTP